MENFNYYTPTKVVFGRGTEEQVGELVREQECKKVLVHYGERKCEEERTARSHIRFP